MAGGIQEAPRPLHPSPAPQGEALTPSQNPQGNLEFTRLYPQPPVVIRTDLTSEHLRRIFEWENATWEEARPFEETSGQIEQELRETRDEWIKVLDGKTELSDDETIHKLREEVGDAIIATVGLVRSVYRRDDPRVMRFISDALNQPDKKRGGPVSKVSAFLLKGDRMMDLVTPVENATNLSGKQKNNLLMRARSTIKAGFVALESLGIGPGQVIDSKIANNKIKYSPERLAVHGNDMGETKDAWRRRQLHVLRSDVVLPEPLAEAA